MPLHWHQQELQKRNDLHDLIDRLYEGLHGRGELFPEKRRVFDRKLDEVHERLEGLAGRITLEEEFEAVRIYKLCAELRIAAVEMSWASR
jgi:hypothetical protein